jgi:hypothetical protein
MGVGTTPLDTIRYWRTLMENASAAFLTAVPRSMAARACPTDRPRDARERIDSKYALGLSLIDPGFDHTVLSEFRLRLIESGAERLLLEHSPAAFARPGLGEGQRSTAHRPDARAGGCARTQPA